MISRIFNRFGDDRRSNLTFLFGAGTLGLGLLVSLQSQLMGRAGGRDLSIGHSLLLTMPFWFAWSAFGPAIVRSIRGIDRRFSDRASLRAVVHCVFAVGTIYAVAAIVYATQRAFALTDLTLPVWQGALGVAFWRVPMSVLLYAVLVGLVYVRDGAAAAGLPEQIAPVEHTQTPAETLAVQPAMIDAKPWIDRIIVKGAGRVTLVSVDEIDWIEAADYCVRLHARGRTHMLRESMTSLENRLDPGRFIRVHRSAIVNLDCVREIQKSFQREHIIILRDGTRVVLSAARRAKLEAMLRDAL